MARYLIILILALLPFFVFCQETKLSESVISIAEELATDDSDPEAVNTYIEKLGELAENPVKINSSDQDEISRLFFLSDFQIKALADYIHLSGQLVTVFELATIPGFDRETVEMIAPFITLDYKSIKNSDSVKWRNSMISNISIKPENNDASSLGSNWKVLTKYRFYAGHFSGGATVEKDAGEKFINQNSRLPDFYSVHIAFNGEGLVRRVIVGDFSARFGQGTNINTAIRRGISLASPGYMSASDEIRPYTSAEGNGFFRGVAAVFSLKNFELSGGISRKNLDATAVYLPGAASGYIDNFYLSGLHNTSELLQKKDAVSESAYLLNLSYNFKNLKIGVIWSENRFSLPVNIMDNDPDKAFGFTGNKNDLYSFYYNGFIKNILLYGEFSMNENRKHAVIQGISFRPADRLTINFLFRNYDPGYTTFYGNGPGSGSKTTNEKGLLGNFSFEAARHLFIGGGFDIQSYPWLKYRCSGPSKGIRQELSARFLPTGKLSFDASFNYRLSMIDYESALKIPQQKNIRTRYLKGSVQYSLTDNVTFRTRIDYKVVDPSGSRGILLLQDIIYKFRNFPLSVWFRYCIFNTDDWDSRLYVYEYDLLYCSSIPALAGEGSRNYLMARWEIGNHAEFRIKYAVTSLEEQGVSMKNTDEFKMQFRIWF